MNITYDPTSRASIINALRQLDEYDEDKQVLLLNNEQRTGYQAWAELAGALEHVDGC